MSTFINPVPKINLAIDDLCKTRLVKHTCQLFEDHGTSAIPFASGVFVEAGGEFYMFTAAHVLSSFGESRRPLVRCKDEFIELAGIVHETDSEKDNTIDLGYFKLDHRLVEKIKLHYEFLPVEKIRQHKLRQGAANYCVIGFPTANQYHDGIRIRTGASALMLQPSNCKVYKHYQFTEDSCFILEMNGKGIDLVTDASRQLKDELYGYSGSGLWQLIIFFNGAELSIDYKLIGIMTEFRKGKYYCLIGNKIELLLQGLILYQGLKIRPRKNHV
ncbi:MAG: hypothetical protein IPK08_10750 [Bacteroidetes bacterium]|nr:hypothetical protein [Bacteroidota bacterium]